MSRRPVLVVAALVLVVIVAAYCRDQSRRCHALLREAKTTSDSVTIAVLEDCPTDRPDVWERWWAR